MVRLNCITTTTGDKGTTNLSDGSTVGKDSLIMEAIGTVDETNCFIGQVIAQHRDQADLPLWFPWLERIQHDLFDLGADLATPKGVSFEDKMHRISAEAVARLDQWIAQENEHLEPLTSFVLPGGSTLAAGLHVIRSQARRCERAIVRALPEMNRKGDELTPIRQYINRLSDLAFVLSRHANAIGNTDVLWVPGGPQE